MNGWIETNGREQSGRRPKHIGKSSTPLSFVFTMASSSKAEPRTPYVPGSLQSRMKISDSLNQFHFESSVDKAKNPTPYWQQGTAAFENSPMRKLRATICQSSRLQSVALQFWTTAGLSESDRAMPRETYKFIHRRISMALAPELSDREAEEAAEEDYETDLQGYSEMYFKQYADGLFGIADMWTESVDELEYVIFLNKLFRRITALREGKDPGCDHEAGGSGGVRPTSARGGTASRLAAISSLTALGPAPADGLASSRAASSAPTLGGESGGGDGAGGGAPSTAVPADGKDSGGAAAGEPPLPTRSLSAEGGVQARAGAEGAAQLPASLSASMPARAAPTVTFAANAKDGLGLKPSARQMWRGLLPTFRQYRDLGDIVPLTDPAPIKPDALGGGGGGGGGGGRTPKSTSRGGGGKSASKRGGKKRRQSRESKEGVGAEAGGAPPEGGGGRSKRKPSREGGGGDGDGDGVAAASSPSSASPAQAHGKGGAPAAARTAAPAAAPSADAAGKTRSGVGFRFPPPPPPPTDVDASMLSSAVGSSAASSPLGSPPPNPLRLPSDDEDEGEDGGGGGGGGARETAAGAPSQRSSFSLKRRGEGGWYDTNGQQIKTPRQRLREAGAAATRRAVLDAASPRGGAGALAAGWAAVGAVTASPAAFSARSPYGREMTPRSGGGGGGGAAAVARRLLHRGAACARARAAGAAAARRRTRRTTRAAVAAWRVR